MVIPDGYTEVLGEAAFRPLVASERAELKRLSLTRGELVDYLSGRIIRGNAGDVPAERLIGDAGQEREDVRNLLEGVRLHAKYPWLTNVTCEQCQAWWFDPLTGRTALREGEPLRRPVGDTLLCQTREGCPKGSPERPKGLSDRNKAAYRHFRECEATGLFPDDPIVKRNAAVIRCGTR